MSHSWDWADGYIARLNKTNGLLGHIHDEIGGVMVVDIVYLWIGLILIEDFSSLQNLELLIIFLMFFRFTKIKNLFYRLLTVNASKFPPLMETT
jgi:phosphatidylglycerophosphate synthase